MRQLIEALSDFFDETENTKSDYLGPMYTPPGHPDHTSTSSLAKSLNQRYDERETLGDLDETITLFASRFSYVPMESQNIWIR